MSTRRAARSLTAPVTNIGGRITGLVGVARQRDVAALGSDDGSSAGEGGVTFIADHRGARLEEHGGRQRHDRRSDDHRCLDDRRGDRDHLRLAAVREPVPEQEQCERAQDPGQPTAQPRSAGHGGRAGGDRRRTRDIGRRVRQCAEHARHVVEAERAGDARIDVRALQEGLLAEQRLGETCGVEAAIADQLLDGAHHERGAEAQQRGGRGRLDARHGGERTRQTVRLVAAEEAGEEAGTDRLHRACAARTADQAGDVAERAGVEVQTLHHLEQVACALRRRGLGHHAAEQCRHHRADRRLDAGVAFAEHLAGFADQLLADAAVQEFQDIDGHDGALLVRILDAGTV